MLLPGGPGLPRVRARSQRPQTECWRELGPHHGGPGAGTRPCPSGSLPSSSQAGPPLRSMLRHTNLAWRPPSIPPPSNLLRSAAFRVVLNLLSTCSSPELRASHKYCVGARGTTELGMGQPAGPRRAQSEPDRNPVVTQAEAHLPDGLGAPHRRAQLTPAPCLNPQGRARGQLQARGCGVTPAPQADRHGAEPPQTTPTLPAGPTPRATPRSPCAARHATHRKARALGSCQTRSNHKESTGNGLSPVLTTRGRGCTNTRLTSGTPRRAGKTPGGFVVASPDSKQHQAPFQNDAEVRAPLPAPPTLPALPTPWRTVPSAPGTGWGLAAEETQARLPCHQAPRGKTARWRNRTRTSHVKFI